MDFNQRISALLQLQLSPLNWDSTLKECDSIEADNLYIPSGFLWGVEYMRYQIELARSNRKAAAHHLKLAIEQNPYSDQLLQFYQQLQPAASPDVAPFAALIVAEGLPAPALALAERLHAAGIEYAILADAQASLQSHSRVIRVDTPAGYENQARKVVAGMTWLHENISPNLGVLRIGQEMLLQDPQRLLERLRLMAAGEVYAGVTTTDGIQHDRCRHWGRCADEALNRRVYNKPFYRAWAAEDAYFLGAAAVRKLVLSMIRFPARFDGEYYEDKLIGDIMLFEGIELTGWQDYADLGLAQRQAGGAIEQEQA